MTAAPPLTEDRVREIVREELARREAKTGHRYRMPCGRGADMPQCMGSAAMGPDGCTCPGVQIEYVDGRRRYP